VKKLTINAGVDSLNEIKHLTDLKSDLYKFLFSLKNMPEFTLKWEMKKVFEPQVRGILNEIKKLEEYFEDTEK